MAAREIGLKQLAVNITAPPFVLAESRPFALPADFCQQFRLQDNIVHTLTEFIQGNGLVRSEKHACEVQCPLIKKQDFGFIIAVSNLVMGAGRAEGVAGVRNVKQSAGVSQQSGHILNKSLAVTFALKEQRAQGVVRAQGGGGWQLGFIHQ